MRCVCPVLDDEMLEGRAFDHGSRKFPKFAEVQLRTLRSVSSAAKFFVGSIVQRIKINGTFILNTKKFHMKNTVGRNV